MTGERELEGQTVGTPDYTDDQRNVSDTLNNAGAAQWAYTYEPFGVTRTATKVSSTAPVNLLGYTGAYTDPATGLLDLRARQYDTATGTFGGRDPQGQSAGTAAFDTFEYAADGPLTGWDPTGRNVWNDITGAASGVGAALEGAAQGGYELATNPVGVVQGLVSACRQGGDGNTVDDAAQCVDNLNPVARIRDTLHQSWDEFEAGCTNLGESSLFNGLTQSALLIAPGADEVGSLGDVADAVQARAAAVRAEMRANPEAGSIQLPGRAGAAEDAGAVFRSDTSHIFRNATGHLAEDTAENRALSQGAIDPANPRSTIRLPDGSTWEKYFQDLPNGTQAWVEVRNGTEITNGGVNATPR